MSERKRDEQIRVMKSLRFGIEIETVGRDRETLAVAIHSVVGGTLLPGGYDVTDGMGRTWKVVPDGSLSGGTRSGEVVSPILNYDDLPQLQELVRAVRRAGARSDASTAIHVHVDMSTLDAGSMARLAKMVHKQEALIELALGITSARRSRYCKPIDPAFMARLEARKGHSPDDLRRAWYGYDNQRPQRYHDSRYAGMNWNSAFVRGSCEFRWFQCQDSLHAGEIKAFVQFALALAAAARVSKSASSRRRAFNPATAKYDMRVFLLGLGFIGEEFETARHHLLKRLAGSAAWKGERRDGRATIVEAGEGEQGEGTSAAQVCTDHASDGEA